MLMAVSRILYRFSDARMVSPWSQARRRVPVPQRCEKSMQRQWRPRRQPTPPPPRRTHQRAVRSDEAICECRPGGDTELAATAHGTALLPKLDEITDASLFVMPGKTALFYGQGLAYITARPQRDLFSVADMTRQRSQATTAAVVALRTEFNALTTDDFVSVHWPYLSVGDPLASAAPHRHRGAVGVYRRRLRPH